MLELKIQKILSNNLDKLDLSLLGALEQRYLTELNLRGLFK